MTFIGEPEILAIAETRGTDERLHSILTSYFHAYDCEFIGRRFSATGTMILFKRSNYSLVLQVPLSAFVSPVYSRVLIQHQVEIAEKERRQAQEQAACI